MSTADVGGVASNATANYCAHGKTMVDSDTCNCCDAECHSCDTESGKSPLSSMAMSGHYPYCTVVEDE